MGKSTVSIVKTKENPGFEEIKEAVIKAVDLIGGIRDIVKRGQLVLINPSLVAKPADRASGNITLPEVSRAVADLVKGAGARPVIAESSAVGVDTESVIAASGYKDLREMGYEVIDLKQQKDLVMIPIHQGKVFNKIQTFPLVKEADAIISIPKLKTHDQTDVTLSIKNLKGLESDSHKKKTHKVGVFDGIVDWFSALKPALAVVDGIICQEGRGPIYGKPVEMDLILAGRDLVAVDATVSRIIGLEAGTVRITAKAAKRDLGKLSAEDIEVVGETIEAVYRKFLTPVEDSPVDLEELDLRLLFGDETCTGCSMTVLSSIIDMKISGQLGYLSGRTIITGNPDIPTDIDPDTIVAIGNCVPKEKRGKHFGAGCPPNNSWIVGAIVGDRGKVSRMYSDQPLSETEKD